MPFLATIYYSFQDWNLARPEERSFAGFDNYVAVVTNGAFLPSLWATVWIVGAVDDPVRCSWACCSRSCWTASSAARPWRGPC